MTRNEKVKAIVDALVYKGTIWGNEREFHEFVASLLTVGHFGYNRMTDEQIDATYHDIIGEEGEEQ